MTGLQARTPKRSRKPPAVTLGGRGGSRTDAARRGACVLQTILIQLRGLVFALGQLRLGLAILESRFPPRILAGESL